MALARANSPQEALLWALNDLEENSFKTLKFHLRDMTQFHLARGELEGLSQVELASKLISMYGAQEAVRVVSRSLQVMNLMELVDYLNQVCLNGECSPREGSDSGTKGILSYPTDSNSLGVMPFLTLPSPQGSPESQGLR